MQVIAGKEFEVEGVSYIARKLNPRVQFHLVRRLAPIIGELGPMLGKSKEEVEKLGLAEVLGPMATAIGKLSDADCDYVLNGALRAVQKGMGPGAGWAPVLAGNPTDGNETLADQTMSMAAMLQVAWESLRYNLEGFSGAPAQTSSEAQPKVTQ